MTNFISLVVVALGSLFWTANALACSLIEVTPDVVSEKMRRHVAENLRYDEGELPADALVTPALNTPVGLGADCSGLHTWYWHSHFEFEDVNPPTGYHCTIRGQIVVLGYTPESSPVAVRHHRSCSTT